MVEPADQWLGQPVVRFSLAAAGEVETAVDHIVDSLGEELELLGFGEALHGGEEILALRNRVFQRLATAHGFSAIAIESSFPRARLVNEFITGRGAASYEEISATGFGHGFGQLVANRELVEWMRAWNADASHPTQLQFYGFDQPTGSMGVASPRQVLKFVTDYLWGINSATGEQWRARIEPLLGEDAAWENPAAYMDPAQSIGVSPQAASLRIATEDLIMEMRARRPEFIAGSTRDLYLEALHYTTLARELLNFHVALATRKPGDSPAIVLGVRDALMAENLRYIVERERPRGKVLVFAHNGHLQRSRMTWPGQKYWGTDAPCEWWPAGALLAEMFGRRYGVIGSAVGVSEENGIAEPEPGTLEAQLVALDATGLFIPTAPARERVTEELRELQTRSGSARNPTYAPLTAKSFTDFDWLAFLAAVTYQRGGPPLQRWDAKESS